MITASLSVTMALADVGTSVAEIFLDYYEDNCLVTGAGLRFEFPLWLGS